MALLLGGLSIWLWFQLKKSRNEALTHKEQLDCLNQVLAQSKDEIKKISSAQLIASKKQAELQNKNRCLSEKNGLTEDLVKRLENKIHSLKMSLSELQVDLGKNFQEIQTLHNQAREVSEKNTGYVTQINQLEFDYKALLYFTDNKNTTAAETVNSGPSESPSTKPIDEPFK